MADCGLPEDEDLIQYGDSLENSACACLDELLERKCDAIIVCQGLMASETIIYLHQKGIRLAQDIDLVSFVDYDSDVYALYANQMDSIIQPVEELGEAAGEQILKRVEEPDAPIFEKVLTSAYKPYNQPAGLVSLGPAESLRAEKQPCREKRRGFHVLAYVSPGSAGGTGRRDHRQRQSFRPPAG